MRVDEAGDDDAVRRIDHLGVAGVDGGTDRGDLVVLDQDVAAVDVADRLIHAQHMAAAEQHALGHDRLPSPVQVVQFG